MVELEYVSKHLSGLWRQSCRLPISIHLLADCLHLECLLPYWLSVERSIIGHNFPFFFGTRNSREENPGVSESCTFFTVRFWRSSQRFLLQVTGRKIDSVRFIETDERGGIDLNNILKPSRTIERIHLLFVYSPHGSIKGVYLPPTGISGHGNIGSEKSWLSELCEG